MHPWAALSVVTISRCCDQREHSGPVRRAPPQRQQRASGPSQQPLWGYWAAERCGGANKSRLPQPREGEALLYLILGHYYVTTP